MVKRTQTHSRFHNSLSSHKIITISLYQISRSINLPLYVLALVIYIFICARGESMYCICQLYSVCFGCCRNQPLSLSYVVLLICVFVCLRCCVRRDAYHFDMGQMLRSLFCDEMKIMRYAVLFCTFFCE